MIRKQYRDIGFGLKVSEANNWAIQSLISNENESIYQQWNCMNAWIISIFVAAQIGVKFNHLIQGSILNTQCAVLEPK